MHKTRLEALKDAAGAALVGTAVSVTALGRAQHSIDEELGIKRMDRLVGNVHLHGK